MSCGVIVDQLAKQTLYLHDCEVCSKHGTHTTALGLAWSRLCFHTCILLIRGLLHHRKAIQSRFVFSGKNNQIARTLNLLAQVPGLIRP